MPCLGIEPSSRALQARANVTRLAHGANFRACTGIRTPSDSLEGCVLSQENTRIYTKLVPMVGIEPTEFALLTRHGFHLRHIGNTILRAGQPGSNRHY